MNSEKQSTIDLFLLNIIKEFSSDDPYDIMVYKEATKIRLSTIPHKETLLMDRLVCLLSVYKDDRQMHYDEFVNGVCGDEKTRKKFIDRMERLFIRKDIYLRCLSLLK